MSPYSEASEFDDNGQVKAPLLFWCGLLLQTRAWWLTVFSIGMGEHGGWLVLIYPELRLQIFGVAAGVPALVMLFCYPARGNVPLLSRGVYVLILIIVVLMLVRDANYLIKELPYLWNEGWLELYADLACCVMLWPDSRLRTVFLL
ncbi:DUF2919 family protein [Salmonella enterica]|nr:DUF2919 family protein [Salmonella enterica]EBA9765496.1 DUF2919 domain-containing protein [Salmonella enterica]EEB5698932.1 DUF2919 family protein [Salmonella enterica]EGX5147487.1 DUF2919 domain-containing protein [Salmonella enterica]EHQ9355025.1 DUF2919 family protein [Salmonella enterica]